LEFDISQYYTSYEYPDFLNSDGDFVEFDSSQYYSSIPGFRQLQESLYSPNPPTWNAEELDRELFARLDRQLSTSNFSWSYHSSMWDENHILNASLRDRAVFHARNSGQLVNQGTEGFHIKPMQYGEVVYRRGRPVVSGNLLQIIGQFRPLMVG
jgi:hypothetical protein